MLLTSTRSLVDLDVTWLHAHREYTFCFSPIRSFCTYSMSFYGGTFCLFYLDLINIVIIRFILLIVYISHYTTSTIVIYN
jgi:hypothetical protein